MIKTAEIVMVLSVVGCLALNWYAFKGDAAAAGHGRKQMVQMAAIWVTIIAALAIAIGWFQP
jgi:hypothetical protein